MLRNLASSTWYLQWNDLVRCRSTTLADALRPGGAERRRFARAARPERREQPTDGQQAPAAGNPHHIDDGSGNFAVDPHFPGAHEHHINAHTEATLLVADVDNDGHGVLVPAAAGTAEVLIADTDCPALG